MNRRKKFSARVASSTALQHPPFLTMESGKHDRWGASKKDSAAKQFLLREHAHFEMVVDMSNYQMWFSKEKNSENTCRNDQN